MPHAAGGALRMYKQNRGWLGHTALHKITAIEERPLPSGTTVNV